MDKLGPVSLAFYGLIQFYLDCGKWRQRMSLHLKKAGKGNLQKRHFSRRGAARQEKERFCLQKAESDAFTGPHFDTAVNPFPLKIFQNLEHQVPFTAPRPPAGNESVNRGEIFLYRRADGFPVVGNDG